MLKVLLKKQLTEVFRGYFFNAKKNRMRSRAEIVAWFLFFAVIVVGLLGGVFTVLARTLCAGLTAAGFGWMYFLLMGGLAIVMGAFGSVFNTYSGLYLAKDNDLLLSLPIPARTIIAARLMNVYLMGTLYSATALLPTLIVYWIVCGVTAARVVCGVLLFVIVTVFVLLLSCLLGWVVAKLSLRLKNRSYISALISLVLIGLYYFVYFRANGVIRDILANADVYGERIKGTAYVAYLFGTVGEGSILTGVVFTAVTLALFGLVWFALERSFLKIATASGATAKARYTEKAVREKSPFSALLGKELARFTSSASYMLNCGLGILLLPAGGILFLLKGGALGAAIDSVLSGRPGAATVLFCAMLCMLASANDIAAPSVSLEGKCIWLPQSLPVPAKTVLRAKASAHLLLTALPMLVGAVCVALTVRASACVKLLIVLMPLAFTFFSAFFGLTIGLRMPLMNWTNELAPIKQSGAVVIALFGGWIVCVLFAGLYLLIGYRLGAAGYLLIWTALLAAAGALLLRWLDTGGARAFAAL